MTTIDSLIGLSILEMSITGYKVILYTTKHTYRILGVSPKITGNGLIDRKIKEVSLINGELVIVTEDGGETVISFIGDAIMEIVS